MQTVEKKGRRVLFPVCSMLLALASLFFPLLLPVVVVWSLYADVRLGSFFSVLGAALVWLVPGSVLWGWPALMLLLILLIPVLLCYVAFRKGLSFGDGLTYSLVAAFLCVAAALVVIWRMAGTGPVEALLNLVYASMVKGDSESLRSFLAMETAVVQLTSTSEAALDQFAALYEEYAAMDLDALWAILRPFLENSLSLNMPAAIVLMTAVAGVLPWVLPGLFLGRRIRRGKPVAPWLQKESVPPAFDRWALPKFVWIACVVVLLATVIASYLKSPVFYAAAQALQIPSAGLLGLQGMSLAAFWLRRKKLPGFLRVIIVLAATLFLGWLMLFLGVWECTVKIRRAIILRAQPERVRQLIEACAEHPEELDKRLTQLAQQIDDENQEEP